MIGLLSILSGVSESDEVDEAAIDFVALCFESVMSALLRCVWVASVVLAYLTAGHRGETAGLLLAWLWFVLV